MTGSAPLLTALAMGVAISLPGGLYLGLANLSQVAGELPAQPEISAATNAGSMRRVDVNGIFIVGSGEFVAQLAAAFDSRLQGQPAAAIFRIPDVELHVLRLQAIAARRHFLSAYVQSLGCHFLDLYG